MHAPLRPGRGFTLIELLTVIAIIAILAAIIFPVFSSVRNKARQNSCLQNMHDIYAAIEQYKADYNHYPVSLGGTTAYAASSVANARQKYLKSAEIFICPDNPNKGAAGTTGVVYPAVLKCGGPNAATAGTAANYSAFDAHYLPGATGAKMLYARDSYDSGPQVDATGAPKNQAELHYSLDWTGISGGADCPNQLKYNDPPKDRTVLTWCTYHAAVSHADVVLVLMLSGRSKAVPVSEFVSKGPLGFTL